MSHPRLPELVLDGLIADPRMKDAMLGDLAEEWEMRAADDGPESADRWYHGQTLRAIPLLLLQWIRQSRWYAVVGILSGVMVVRVVSAVAGAFMMAVTSIALRAFGYDPDVATLAGAFASATLAFGAGATVALMSRRAAMPAILCLACAVLMTTIGISNEGDNMMSAHWYRLTEKMLSIPAAIAGGLFVVYRRRRPAIHSENMPA